jgi:uncharacterized protein YuzB (UPF0349 family)
LDSVTFKPGSRLQILHAGAFCDSTIQSIEIPASVTALPVDCFAHCGILSSATFAPGSQLRCISSSAFAYSGIESMNVPRSVEELGVSCFEGCARLVELTFEPGCQLRCLGDSALCFCISLVSICVPSSVESIGGFCFCECEKLDCVTFESGSKLSTIAFSADAGLPSIELPSSLEIVPRSCLGECVRLSVVTFAPISNVREIREFAFRGCSLASMCVPSSCLKIDWNCFSSPTREIEVAFESPAKIQSIFGLNGDLVKPLVLPDSLAAVTVERGGDPGFGCSFGRESQLRHLSIEVPRLKGRGFMRMSERSLKQIRPLTEWRRSGATR